ncbi:MAG: hypothetical protein IJ489_08850 [Clostridia bacterium]|nr:hypothetical protein [Clostridia bacterium]
MNERTLAIRRGLPVTVSGITLYPVLMTHYEEFLSCKDVFSMRLSSLPAAYASMDYLSALYRMDYDFSHITGNQTGIFERALQMYALSMRISSEEMANGIRVRMRDEEPVFEGLDIGGVLLSSFQLSTRFREIIAEQNGILLPNESDNAEIMESYKWKQKKEAVASRLRVSLDDLIASVAFQSRLREADILDFTVHEFERRRNAIDRDKRYSLYTGAELSGFIKFKNGNPAPSWCFDLEDGGLGTVATAEITKKLDGN